MAAKLDDLAGGLRKIWSRRTEMVGGYTAKHVILATGALQNASGWTARSS